MSIIAKSHIVGLFVRLEIGNCTHTNQEDEMNHTPIPWQAYSDADHNQAQVVLQGDGIRSVIATCYRGNLCDEHGGSHEGNAKFIVTACNAHEELVAALNAMVSTWDCYLSNPSGYPAYQKAKKILATIEKGA